MVVTALQIYILMGIFVGICLSKSESFGIGKTKKTEEGNMVKINGWERIKFGIYISGLWPVALINYWIHFRGDSIE